MNYKRSVKGVLMEQHSPEGWAFPSLYGTQERVLEVQTDSESEMVSVSLTFHEDLLIEALRINILSY